MGQVRIVPMLSDTSKGIFLSFCNSRKTFEIFFELDNDIMSTSNLYDSVLFLEKSAILSFYLFRIKIIFKIFRNDKSEDSEEREEVGGRLEDEDDDEEEFVEEEENIEEKINEDEAIPDSNEGAGQAEDQKTPSDEIIQGEVIKTLEDEKLEEKPQEEILSAELDLDIEVMGSHIEAEIPVDDKELEEVEEILSKELEEQLHAPKIEIIDDEKEVEKQVDPSVIQIASPDVPEIAKEPINVPKKKVPNWIDAGIEKHLEDQKKKPAQKLLGRVKEQKPADNGLAHYINDLHKIGFDEDEIESMLKEVNIARMSEHVSELKRRVENYLAEHRHDNHEPHEDEPHSHDEKWIPGTV